MLNIRHKRFVFLEPTNVHMIAKPCVYRKYATQSYHNMQILSVPFYNAQDEWQNVHVGFLHEEHALAYAKPSRAFVFTQGLDDATYYSNVTHTPLVVIKGGTCDLDSKTEVYDVHFHRPKRARWVIRK